ncbi:MAG TPA: VCBS repeat-containing protein [Terriglobales bacterium]|jgi:hypothetical protein
MKFRSLLCSLLLCAAASAQIKFSKVTVAANHFPGSVVSGDFDRDGRPDLAAIADGDQLTIYRNLGSGKFSTVSHGTVLTNNNAVHIDTADVNNDGKLDIVVGKQFDGDVEVWLGNGDGSFTLFTDEQLTTATSIDFKLGDVNGDHIPDLLVMFNDDTASGVVVFLNDGHGNFTAHNPGIAASTVISNWALADFNGDGKMDVLLRVRNQLQDFSGDGHGNFTLHSTSSVNAGTGTLTVGSFNHDSRLDVALRIRTCDAGTCTASSRDKVYTYLNDGTGHFGLRSITNAGVGFGDMFAGDLNGDGIQDLAISNIDLTNGTAVPFQYILNAGDARFGVPFSPGTFDRQDTPLIRDLNRDGRHDIVLPAGGALQVLLNTNAPVICALPSSATLNAKFCGLANGSSVAKTFTVKASADSPAGVARVELWLDGKKQFELWNDELQRSLTVSAGTHRVAVVAVDRYGATSTKAINVTAH